MLKRWLLKVFSDDPLELFICDEHDDIPRTDPHKCWNEPTATDRTFC